MGTSTPVIIEAVPAKPVTSKKRQRRPLELKRRIVEETLIAGASVARVALAHGVNANQVFQWRRLYEQGRLGNAKTSAARLLPVTVADPGTQELQPDLRPGSLPPATAGGSMTTGTIHLELRKARVRIEGNIDPVLLRLVLESVLG